MKSHIVKDENGIIKYIAFEVRNFLKNPSIRVERVKIISSFLKIYKWECSVSNSVICNRTGKNLLLCSYYNFYTIGGNKSIIKVLSKEALITLQLHVMHEAEESFYLKNKLVYDAHKYDEMFDKWINKLTHIALNMKDYWAHNKGIIK